MAANHQASTGDVAQARFKQRRFLPAALLISQQDRMATCGSQKPPAISDASQQASELPLTM